MTKWEPLDWKAILPQDQIMTERMIKLGGHTPLMQNGSVMLTRPGAVSGRGCSIGHIKPGVVKIFSDAWRIPDGRLLPDGAVMNVDELDAFVQHNEQPERFWMVMGISDQAFLMGCLSADGCVASMANGTFRVELIASVEYNWIEQVQAVARRAGIATAIYGPQKNGLYHLQARSTLQAYLALREAEEYAMPRKWQKLKDYFEAKLPDMEMHVAAYQKVMQLIAAGVSMYGACKRVKEEFGVKGNTVQFWVYNEQKPRLLCLPEVS